MKTHLSEECPQKLVECTNDGCTEKIKRKLVGKHTENECGWRTVQCEYAVFGCNVPDITANTLEAHNVRFQFDHLYMKMEHISNRMALENQRLKVENERLDCLVIANQRKYRKLESLTNAKSERLESLIKANRRKLSKKKKSLESLVDANPNRRRFAEKKKEKLTMKWSSSMKRKENENVKRMKFENLCLFNAAICILIVLVMVCIRNEMVEEQQGLELVVDAPC